MTLIFASGVKALLRDVLISVRSFCFCLSLALLLTYIFLGKSFNRDPLPRLECSSCVSEVNTWKSLSVSPPSSFSRCVRSGVRHALENGHVSRRIVREDEGKGTQGFSSICLAFIDGAVLFMSVFLLFPVNLGLDSLNVLALVR